LISPILEKFDVSLSHRLDMAYAVAYVNIRPLLYMTHRRVRLASARQGILPSPCTIVMHDDAWYCMIHDNRSSHGTP
jgi:hypothetical protein